MLDLCFQAIKHGHTYEVKTWIKQHAPDESSMINSVVDTSHGDVKNVKTVLPRKNMTALNYAAFFGKIDIVQLLLDHGAGK
jgi:ankyrin repeat protein